MNNILSASSKQVIYIPHGGGPLPLLGDPNHQGLVDFLTRLPGQIRQPSAIIVISAHWEAEQPTITSGATPELIYDYYGFPAEAYEIKYPAVGDPELAQELYQLLRAGGFDASMDSQRGFDHGMYVPLKLMYPKADIPCVQLSLVKGLDPDIHMKMGKAIASLQRENVLVIGSGMSFHNMQSFMSTSSLPFQRGQAFNDWLVETLTTGKFDSDECQKRLINWEQAPHARYCHPREEHLLPLHTCFGIAMDNASQADVIYRGKLMNQGVLSIMWS